MVVANDTLLLFPEYNVKQGKQLNILTDLEELPELLTTTQPVLSKEFESVGSYAQLANGDCLEHMKNIPDGSVDLILTDPPYNLGLFMQNRETNLVKMRENHFAYSGWDDMPFDEWHESMKKFFAESNRGVHSNLSYFIFIMFLYQAAIA